MSRNFAPFVFAGLAGLALLGPAPCFAQPSSYTISTYAGTGPSGNVGEGTYNSGAGFAGDDSAPTQAQFNFPVAIALDSSHNLYIADSGNYRIREVSGGKVNTIAGNGEVGYNGDGGPATSAAFDLPYGVAVDGAGNVYISDLHNQIVRQVNTKGVINTFAGNNCCYGYFADGLPATNPSASLNQPVGLAVDAAGDLYIADSQDYRVRVVTTGGILNSVAGGFQGADPGNGIYGGDGGPAIPCDLNVPLGVAVDSKGNVYIADSENHRIRKVTPAGIITTVAGNGTGGYSGDGGPAVDAELNRPWSVAVDSVGDLFIADYNNSRIREVNTQGIISTIAGGYGPGYSGDGGPALQAMLSFPTGLALDTNGTLYVADASNNVIRALTPTAPAVAGGGVISASSFGAFPAIAPGSWIEIYGTNLALDDRSWTGSDFQGASAPTSLDGTTVTIGGQSAFIEYISGGQINAQVPSNVSTGQQQVVVKTAAGTSASYTVTVNATEPGLFAPASFKVGGIQYAGATFNDYSTYVAPAGAIPGVTSEPATPGQTIVLYGVGFGSVTPNIPAGQIVSGSNTLSQPVQISIGGAPATVTFQGLAAGSIGLYQFNVTVPNIPANNKAALTFTQGGATGSQTLYIAVQ
ncbi:MAG TPA: IPT/TIG domain-containing protein [Bryobacteraceae bacterium]|nr:IPT/TIG domain-containing protein [Bryobacteraceae bacterium]